MPEPLPLPVRATLEAPLDDTALERVLAGVDEARARRRRAARGRRLAAGAAAATSLAAVAAAALLAWPRPPAPPRAPSPAAPSFAARAPAAAATVGDGGPLRLASDQREVGPLAADDAPVTARLSDGSVVRLDPGARLLPLENNGRAFTALLAAGRVAFDVQPGGPRRWSIECGVATVEVIGTRFVVERAGARASVRVAHGVVLVRGEQVPERVQRLIAGQALELGARDAPLASSAAPPAQRPRAPAPWRDLAARGAYAAAWDALGTGGVARTARGANVSPDELLALADVARLSGHAGDAVGPLERLLREHPRDPNAAFAAFTLGRIELDALGRPARAAAAFAQAAALGLPRSLDEDALARLVEARARAGDAAGARAAADAYEARYPAGRRAGDVRQWRAGGARP